MLFKSILPWAALTFCFSGAIAQSDATTKTGWTGKLSSLDGGLQGVVTVVDSTTLLIKGYTLEDGHAPALYWWGSTSNNLKDGFRISNMLMDKVVKGQDLTVKLNVGKTTADFSTVGLWCERFSVNFGQTVLQPGAGGGSSPASSASSVASVSSGGSGGSVGSPTSTTSSVAQTQKPSSAIGKTIPIQIGLAVAIAAGAWLSGGLFPTV
jgi:hypothetical protein